MGSGQILSFKSIFLISSFFLLLVNDPKLSLSPLNVLTLLTVGSSPSLEESLSLINWSLAELEEARKGLEYSLFPLEKYINSWVYRVSLKKLGFSF